MSTRIGYLPQELTEQIDGSVIAEVLRGAAHLTDLEEQMLRDSRRRRRGHRSRRLRSRPGRTRGGALESYGEAQHRFETLGGYGVGVPRGPSGAGRAGVRRPRHGPTRRPAVRRVAHAGCGRVALARLMLRAGSPGARRAHQPPRRGIRAAWLERRRLAHWPGAILFVSHDRDFLDAVAERVVEVAHGRAIEYVVTLEELVHPARGADRRWSRRCRPTAAAASTERFMSGSATRRQRPSGSRAT